MVSTRQHPNTCGLKDADVGGVAGTAAVTLTANSTPATPATPTRWSRPSAISKSQHEAHWSAHAENCTQQSQPPRCAGLAEWLHHEARAMLGIPAAQGQRYSWGYPAVPEQSEHLKVERLLDLSDIGMHITDGYAPEPEQSTLAPIAHHPQAIYFGTRQGRLLSNGAPR